MKNIAITGGAGFIGSNFCHLLHRFGNFNIFVIDNLTYAANLKNLEGVKYKLFKTDIANTEFVEHILVENNIDVLVNFAAESHVDNSISSPDIFIHTNIIGTYSLIKAGLKYQQKYNSNFKYIHVSTDEVFGDLDLEEPKFTELTAYKPSSPYSASKAASDHLVYAWHRTYGLNAIITNCTNNYGKFQYPEKLIPKTILACLNEKNIPVYGNGKNIRDWIFVEDHCNGIFLAMSNGKFGESYCFGGDNEISTLEVVNSICKIMNSKHPRKNGKYEDLITFVEDRKGHDFRYAIDDIKAQKELNFKRSVDFETGLEKTIDWYLQNAK